MCRASREITDDSKRVVTLLYEHLADFARRGLWLARDYKERGGLGLLPTKGYLSGQLGCSLSISHMEIICTK